MNMMNTLNIPVDVDVCFREEFRILRTRLDLIRNEKKILMVTSMLSGEGKTTVAMNLSRSLADIGKRVIFVECDLKKSEISAWYGVEDNGASIQSYLASQKNLEEIILKSEKENLDLILSFGSSANSAELLDSERFRMMLVELKEKYDFVIIDTPSMIEYIDSTIIARESDAVLLVIQENNVKTKIAEKGLERFREAKCEVLGVVLNRVEV